MRKSNLVKILVAMLTFSLLLGAIVGITTTAADEGDVYLENADVERNVQYESQTYLLYRVKKSAIKEEDKATLCMQIASTDGSIVGKITPKESGDYYVFTTQGVPAKEINTKEVVTIMSGSKAISPAITWSVEEYLYARLYADKYADVTEGGKAAYGVDDGKDYIRRNLYYDLLKTGYNAQMVLAPDAEDKIGDSAFVVVNDALATYGKFDEPTKITLRYDDTKTPAGDTFLGWEYSIYDNFGEFVKEGYAADQSAITAEGYVKAKPVYASEYYVHSYIDFKDSDAIPAEIIPVMNDGYGTASVVDGKFVLDQSLSGKNNYWYVSPTTKLAEADTVVFEADFSIKVTSGSEAGYLSIYTGTKNNGSQVYWAYMKVNGSYLQITNEYSKTGGVQTANAVKVTTPIKVDGTSYKLRIIYRECDWGEDYLEFYADGKLFHTSKYFFYTGFNDNKQGPEASGVNSIAMNFPSGTVGTMTLDNVAMTQCVSPKFERLGMDESVIDFDASLGNVNRYTPETENKYYSDVIDPKTGNGYVLLTKKESGGLSIDVPVTYTEEGADLAVLSFDYYMEDSVTRMDNQIFASHKHYNSYSNDHSPVMVSMSTSHSGYKGKWIHVEIYYRVVATDENGSVTKVSITPVTTNGPHAYNSNRTDAEVGIYKSANTKFKIFGAENGIEIPKANELTGMRISLNSDARGDVRFDNLSFKLIKE